MRVLGLAGGVQDLGAGGLDGGERGPVLQGFELRLGVRVVVADVRAGVGLSR
jgi:hypothetical protein